MRQLVLERRGVTPKRISASLFALILGCFFLPFVTVSCENRPIEQLTGIELATGTTITTPAVLETTQSQNLPPDIRATLAVGVAAAGVGISLSNWKRRSQIAIGLSTVGVLLLFALRSEANRQLFRSEIAYYVQVSFESGCWLAVLPFLIAGIYDVAIALGNRSTVSNQQER
ncbi:hypothetical protein ACQ4M3_42265 [Leptolyngbya sp. AN03gr2]|uniref:hypothetical protein n=1 Tax=unclassified Leptolyngbya TaxID=2650499 RepID=UPI003D323427